jgi:hypothetical protein
MIGNGILFGMRGNDYLRASGRPVGTDSFVASLDGGPGFDTCVTATPEDTVDCEVIKAP